MLKFYILTLILTFAVVSNGYAVKDHPLRKGEEALGTDDKLNWTFHRVVEDKEGIGYRFPGYLIGIEKSKRKVIGVNSPIDPKLKLQNLKGKNKEKIIELLEHPKRMFISHIVRYDFSDQIVPRIKSKFNYNIYEKMMKDTSAAGQAYNLSWMAMADLKEELKKRILKEKFTHFFVFAMGWNTDQQEAIRNYNSLYGNLMEFAEVNKKKSAFKPLFFGFSWPSSWRIPVISYFNKANDADEVGAVWINMLINQVLLPIKDENAGRVVVVGHSFGARAITRAVFSKPLLFDNELIPEKLPDLVIGLQGAFSINRFIDGKGREGTPYMDFKNTAKQFVFTWSNSDTANPFANFVTGADHIGGKYGYKAVLEPPESNHFWLLTLKENGKFADNPVLEETKQRILLVDASDIIKYGTYEKGGKSHSDIYKPEIAKFMWTLIQTYAP